MDEKITLDRKSFEALAANTRVQILKSLNQRRKTLSELASQLKLSPSTVKEHMVMLQEAQLVEMKDEGRKWKYYELTWKGKNIVEPREIKIWVVLGLSAIVLIASLFSFYSKLPAGQELISVNDVPEDMIMEGANAEEGRAVTAEAPGAFATEPPEFEESQPDEGKAAGTAEELLPDLGIALIAAIAFGISLGYLIKKRS